ncbi:MAG: glycosyltransferase [Lachnospiraceae bacterium]|nr:glycosyltransferase [Lachnospiraceae bacterium]
MVSDRLIFEDKALISVIMCTYNEPVEWVEEAVNSILCQSYKVIEFIIVVDDPTNHAIVDFLYSLNDERIRIYINEKNLGLVKSLNRAIKYCKGEYIARMDADDISYKNRLERQLIYLENKKLDLVGCDFLNFDTHGNLSIKKGGYSFEVCMKLLKIGNYIAHPTWLAKKKLFYDLDGYREIETCEDYDFLRRAINRGYSVANVNEVLFQYRQNNLGISSSNWAKQATITRILADNYNMGYEVTEKECVDKLNGKYLKEYDNYVLIRSLRNKYKNSNNIIKKVWSVFQVMRISTFYYEKYKKYKSSLLIKGEHR